MLRVWFGQAGYLWTNKWISWWLKFPVKGEEDLLFYWWWKNLSSHLSTWDSLGVLNDTQAFSKATEAAGHQRVVDRQTDSELHVKSLISLQNENKTEARARAHTHTTPKKRSHHPPRLSVVKYCVHLKTYTSLHPSFFKSFYLIFFHALQTACEQA